MPVCHVCGEGVRIGEVYHSEDGDTIGHRTCITGRPEKPKVATIFEIAENLELTFEQIDLELKKSHPDMELVKKMIIGAHTSAIAINGLLNLKSI